MSQKKEKFSSFPFPFLRGWGRFRDGSLSNETVIVTALQCACAAHGRWRKGSQVMRKAQSKWAATLYYSYFQTFLFLLPPPARSTCVHFQFAWWCRTHHALGTLGKYFRRWGVTTGTNVINPICTSRSRPNFFSLFFFPFLSSRPTRSTIQLKVLSLFQNMQLATQLMASVPKSCGTTLTRIHAAVITNTLSITCR